LDFIRLFFSKDTGKKNRYD
jgi:hypothetical protein